MVVEATVEGDVTRFTGIYVCRKSKDLVGPVRSGRYYSIDLWQDLHVLPFFFGAESEGIGRYHRAHMPYVNGIRVRGRTSTARRSAWRRTTCTPTCSWCATTSATTRSSTSSGTRSGTCTPT